MNPEQFKELQDKIGQLLDLDYTMSQIENILDLDIHVETIKVQLVIQTVPSKLIDAFEINMN